MSPLPRTAGMLPHIGDPSENSSTVHHLTHCQTAERPTRQDRGTVYLFCNSAKTADHCNIGKVAIKMIPEEVLLEVFAFYMRRVSDNFEWKTLIHVCRRWRSIVFAAPRRLNLRFFCTCTTPVAKMLDIWPALPIVIQVYGVCHKITRNVLAALEKNDRICEVNLNNVPDGELKRLAGAMQGTFPTLTGLDIHSFGDTSSVPESFLGGSAPNLRSLRLMNIAFPTLPKLLSSSPGLVSLSLFDIPRSWHISSDVMVDWLSSLTRLEYLQICFLPSRSCTDRENRRPPPLTRTVFPVLSEVFLKGVTEHLDQILARMEAPTLNYVHITFHEPPIFDISQIS